MANYTVQDMLGSLIAFVLFTSVFLFPGYVTGWVSNLFLFRERRSIVRFVLAIPLSFAISPILLFLAARLLSIQFAIVVLFAMASAFAFILWRTNKWERPGTSIPTNGNLKRSQRQALFIAAGWTVFVVLFLIDWQSQGRLWLNSVSYDSSTRVQIIQAITRTGVPPDNPSYYPGHAEKLTLLYYFWYVLCSLIDGLGGKWVDARTAMIASVAWCGLGTMAIIGVYLRLRSKAGLKVWNSALLGIGSLTISGLDLFPTLFFLVGTQLLFGRIGLYLPGDIEHWNEQITTWIGSFAWVPHHVAAVLACLVGMMLWQTARNDTLTRRMTIAVLAGLGFASAFGLSVWVTIIFAVFWGIWMLTQFLQRERPWPMLLSGLVAFLAVLPFLLDMLKHGSNDYGDGFPLALSIRKFGPLALIIEGRPAWQQSLMHLLALPINYLSELGFFFLVAVFWPVLIGKARWKSNPYYYAEMLLLLIVIIFVTFIRSTIGNNDYGWRGWLLGQFVLLIWGVDLLEYFQGKQIINKVKVFKFRIPLSKVESIMKIFMVAGISTTLISLSALRFWTILVDAGVAGYPQQFSADTALGRKVYAGRQAFEYIDRHTPQDVIIQFNPRVLLDYPAGLYRKRQTIISAHTWYGIPYDRYRQLTADIGNYFASPQDWISLDKMCHQYSIDILIVRDTDPLWDSLDELKMQRIPLFLNSHDAIFKCGFEE